MTESTITDILVIVGILVFSIALAGAGIAIVGGIAQKAALSTAEDAARDIAAKITKLYSTSSQNIEALYILPDTSDGSYTVTMKESTVIVEQTLVLNGKTKTKIGHEITPDIEINQKCSDPKSLKFIKSSSGIKVKYCTDINTATCSWVDCDNI